MKSIKRPRSIQGYAIEQIYHNVKIPSRDPKKPWDTSMGQRCAGLGVSGPNVSETDPIKLIKLGTFLRDAGVYLISLKHQAELRGEKPRKGFFGIRDRGGVTVSAEDVTLKELRRLKKLIDGAIEWRLRKRK